MPRKAGLSGQPIIIGIPHRRASVIRPVKQKITPGLFCPAIVLFQPVSIINHTRNIEAYHHYVGKFEQDGKPYYIRFTVQQMKSRSSQTQRNIAHSSFVSEVSIYEKSASADPASFRVIDPSFAHGTAPFDVKLSSWFQKVKAAFKSSSQVVDENGETLVVYHGTEIDISKHMPLDITQTTRKKT
jgi:hypothetical protein